MAVFEAMGVYAPDETHARAEVLYENYTNTLSVEIETMVAMAKTGFLPACAKDLALRGGAVVSWRQGRALWEDQDGLRGPRGDLRGEARGAGAEATYLCDVCKPKMDAKRRRRRGRGRDGRRALPVPDLRGFGLRPI